MKLEIMLVCLTVLCSISFVYCLARPTRDRVIGLLEKHGVDYKSWDPKKGANTLDDLISFIESGEISLKSHPDGILIVHINVAVATISCLHNRRLLELREYRNGARRPFTGSLGEKILGNEKPEMAIRRGLIEELGQTEPKFNDQSLYTLEADGREVRPPQPSEFYHGAFDVYSRKKFKIRIDPTMYHTRYVAHDNGREICFMWVDPENDQRA
jgi:hypothetical protein